MKVDRALLIKEPIAHYPAATVACFDPTCGDLPRRKLDEPANVRFLERLAEAGAAALLIASSTGQGHLRTVGELEQWFRSAAEARVKHTVRIALLRPEDGQQANRRLLGLLKELGYLVVFVRPGTDLPPDASDAQVADNMRGIVEEATHQELAVGLYSIPDVSGLRLTPEAAARLVKGPGGESIVAIKVTEADYESGTRRFLHHTDLKHLKVVQGWDPHLARALRDGPRLDEQGRQRCGVTSGPMSMAVYQYLHIFQAAEHKDWPEVAAAQHALTTLFGAMQDDPSRFADLQRAKYVMGLGHPLMATVTEAQAEHLLEALESLPRQDDRSRLARSLDLMGDGPYHDRLSGLI